jgi:hypothetical protein
VVLEQVILAGPNSDLSNTDPYCFDECGPDGLGEYDVDECVSCYKVSENFYRNNHNFSKISQTRLQILKGIHDKN